MALTVLHHEERKIIDCLFWIKTFYPLVFNFFYVGCNIILFEGKKSKRFTYWLTFFVYIAYIASSKCLSMRHLELVESASSWHGSYMPMTKQFIMMTIIVTFSNHGEEKRSIWATSDVANTSARNTWSIQTYTKIRVHQPNVEIDWATFIK